MILSSSSSRRIVQLRKQEEKKLLAAGGGGELGFYFFGGTVVCCKIRRLYFPLGNKHLSLAIFQMCCCMYRFANYFLNYTNTPALPPLRYPSTGGKEKRTGEPQAPPPPSRAHSFVAQLRSPTKRCHMRDVDIIHQNTVW